MEWNEIKKLRVLEWSGTEGSDEILYPFAIDEVECERVGRGEGPALHLWTHAQALVVGIRDGKLPHAWETMEQLKQDGLAVGVRHSGGAAVPLDAGVLNVSLILPKPAGAMDFREDFVKMVQMLDWAVTACGMKLDQGEVIGSYCPGDYDLSIQGRKFCGIAQRRQTRAIAIQAFILVEGRGEERVKRAQTFYESAVGPTGAAGLCYPKVVSGTMASLTESGPATVTVKSFKDVLLGQLMNQGITLEQVQGPDEEKVAAAVASIQRRYQPSS